MGQSKRSSALEYTCRLQNMAFVKALVFFLSVSGALGARQLRGSVQGRDQRSLEPQRTRKHVTKLVPKLEPTEECVDVPKEVCTRSRTNPRKVKKPVVKKWCYIPTEESGLA